MKLFLASYRDARSKFEAVGTMLPNKAGGESAVEHVDRWPSYRGGVRGQDIPVMASVCRTVTGLALGEATFGLGFAPRFLTCRA